MTTETCEYPYEGKMVGLYERWLEKNQLPAMSADELLYEVMADTPTDKNIVQQKWLSRFIKVWNYFSSDKRRGW